MVSKHKSSCHSTSILQVVVIAIVIAAEAVILVVVVVVVVHETSWSVNIIRIVVVAVNYK